MLRMLARDWWVFAVRGVAAITFAVAAFIWPEQTVTVLTLLFGAYLLVDGFSMLGLLAAGDPSARRSAWSYALIGVISIGLGICAFVWTDTVALSLLYVIAAWSVVVGALQVYAAYELRRVLEGEIWMAIGGILTIIFGVLLVIYPAAGMISLVWLVALWAIVSGMSSLALAYRLRQLNSDIHSPAAV